VPGAAFKDVAAAFEFVQKGSETICIKTFRHKDLQTKAPDKRPRDRRLLATYHSDLATSLLTDTNQGHR
jgi:hypothetical protein